MWTVLVVVAVYAALQLGYYFIDGPRHKIGAPDPDAADGTLVVLRINEIDTYRNVLQLDVLVYPEDELLDRHSGTLIDEAFVRLNSKTEIQDIRFARDRVPAKVSTTLRARGDPDNWPFDLYVTEPTAVSVVSGGQGPLSGLDAQVAVAGHIDGWYIDHNVSADQVAMTLQRTQGSLAFDVGICLILISLPVIAMPVAIGTLRGTKKYEPGHSALLAVMLFAIVPLRSILPGAPPPGAWVDQTIVLWVLIALVAALAIHLAAWWRQDN